MLGERFNIANFVFYRMLRNPANQKMRFLMSSFDEETRDKVQDLFKKNYAEYIEKKLDNANTKEVPSFLYVR